MKKFLILCAFAFFLSSNAFCYYFSYSYSKWADNSGGWGTFSNHGTWEGLLYGGYPVYVNADAYVNNTYFVKAKTTTTLWFEGGYGSYYPAIAETIGSENDVHAESRFTVYNPTYCEGWVTIELTQLHSPREAVFASGYGDIHW